MRAKKVVFITREYLMKNGSEPKGTGRWAFKGEFMDLCFSPSMTYSEAKKWMEKKVKENPFSDPVTKVLVVKVTK